MAVRSRKLVSRALRQMDRSFWSLHDDLPTFAVLALPTFFALATLGLAAALTVRLYDLAAPIAFLAWWFVLPLASLATVTFCPLPCSIFVWSRAQGTTTTAGQCFSTFFRRMRRLVPVIIWLLFSYFWWALLFWIPTLVLWPRTCLAPMVALFEVPDRVFVRARKLMHEDHAIYVLAGLYLLLSLVISGLIFVPRLVLLADVFKTPWAVRIGESIWAFELVFGILALTGVAVSWCVALTLFYHDLRRIREGEGLRHKVDTLYGKYVPTGESA